MMETSIEISKKQGEFPFAAFSRQGAGWLYSTPVSKKAYSEPVREEFSVAVTGEIVRRWRDDINNPFSYEIFPGWLEFKLVGVLLMKREIKNALKNERLLVGDEADEFIKIIRSSLDTYRELVEDALKKEITDFVESSHPLIAFFTFRDEDIIKSILYCVDRLFPTKKDALTKFVEKYRDELMTVKLVRKFKVHRGN